MLVGAVSALVFLFDTVFSVVVPSLTFQASNWLPLRSFYMTSPVADSYPVRDCPVGCVSIAKGQDKMSCPLLRGSSVQWLDPSHRRYDVVLQVVGFTYFVSVFDVIWVDGDWDVEHLIFPQITSN